MSLRTIAIGTYLALAGWQPVWLLVLPPPAGPRNALLAVVALVPLLVPLRGVASGRLRSMIWGAYLAVFYFVLGVMETWSNAAMRPAALVQLVLSLGYVLAVAGRARRPDG